MTAPILQELQDALDWQEMSTIKKIVTTADTSVNWSRIRLQTEHLKNQEIVNLFAANDAFDCIWGEYSVIDYAVQCTSFCQWLMKNKAYCLYEGVLLNVLNGKPNCVKLLLATIAAKKTTVLPKSNLMARALLIALGTKNPVLWKQVVVFFPICLDRSIIRVDDDRSFHEPTGYKHAG